MIKSIEEKPVRQIEVDLRGPDGNAYCLMSLAASLGKQLCYDKIIIEDIIKTMTLSDYEDLINTFDIWFGDYVILYR